MLICYKTEGMHFILASLNEDVSADTNINMFRSEPICQYHINKMGKHQTNLYTDVIFAALTQLKTHNK